MKKLYFRAPVLTASGYGVHSRQLLAALFASGKYDLYVDPVRWGNTSFLHETGDFYDKVRASATKLDEARKSGVKFDVAIHVTIGVTAGIETDRVTPAWIHACNDQIDALIVPSTHSANGFGVAYQKKGNGDLLALQRPLSIVSEGVDTTAFNSVDQLDEPPELVGAPDKNFLIVGLGFGDGNDRKNNPQALRWLLESLEGTGCGIVLKCQIVNGSLLDMKTLESRVKRIKNETKSKVPVTLIHGRVSDLQLASIYKSKKVAALVSLTHGEGFGLPLAEAACCGVPVIATNWSGHIDFLGGATFLPVACKLGAVGEPALWKDVIEPGCAWAFPEEGSFKAHVKAVVEDDGKLSADARSKAPALCKLLSLESTGAKFVSVVDSIVDRATIERPQSRSELVVSERKRIIVGKKKPLLYTMPMSAGDVVISTAVVARLHAVYGSTHDIYFATQRQYQDILTGNPDIDFVVDWQDWMADVSICEEVFDLVFTPNLDIQLVTSNWVRKGRGTNIVLKMAEHCGLTMPDQPKFRIDPVEPKFPLPEKFIALHAGSGAGVWSARRYTRWDDVVTNLKRMTGLEVVQVGAADDREVKGCVSCLGKTSYRELAGLLKKASLLVSIDSAPMHIAAVLHVPTVSIFGSSNPINTRPWPSGTDTKQFIGLLAARPERCQSGCYKPICKVDQKSPCINEISPATIVGACKVLVGGVFKDGEEYKEKVLKLSGYTHVYNAVNAELPFVESIKSMCGFCDEVIVVDGGSTDGTVEAVKAIGDPKVQVHVRPWDWEEPGMDGAQKAFGRALCSGDFLWQQDADEIVRERDFAKARDLMKKFPDDELIMHLPVIELWGDDKTVRTDRHSWKWRLSRNDFRVSHGINVGARVLDEKTGKMYAKKGMSDGCEYVDIMTGEMLPHFGFYTKELEQLRNSDPTAYGERMLKAFDELPSVVHMSWADLPRKIRSFKRFWNKCWANLYNEEKPEDRFPSVSLDDQASIDAAVEELRVRGGERSAPTFKIG
jgi:ADP-heptose:LPS heptosyltransferase/glycosyltransferase involved in cell wall biosynthesis